MSLTFSCFALFVFLSKREPIVTRFLSLCASVVIALSLPLCTQDSAASIIVSPCTVQQLQNVRMLSTAARCLSRRAATSTPRSGTPLSSTPRTPHGGTPTKDQRESPSDVAPAEDSASSTNDLGSPSALEAAAAEDSTPSMNEPNLVVRSLSAPELGADSP